MRILFFEYDDYVLYDNDDFFKSVNMSLIQTDKQFRHKKEFYTLFLYNLLTFEGKATSKILIAINTTPDEKRYNNIIVISILNLILLLTIIFFIVYYAFRFYEKRIKKLTETEKHNERVIHQQSKMASMGEMIGNIAHQWRQPLSTISTIASGVIVQKEYGIFNDDTLEKSMTTIMEQTEYMSKTIDDFRDFFKSDKEKIKFELNSAIKQNISLINSTLKGHNINLEFKDAGKIDLTGYQNELTQAILNIISNSKEQLMKLDKSIDKHIKIEISKDDDNIIITVIDNGGGINKKIIHKIFDPYFTTKHQSQGTGIGLYMTHEIIVKHFDGKITAENQDIVFKNKKYTCAVVKVLLPHKVNNTPFLK